MTTEETDDLRRREVAALEAIANKPVVFMIASTAVVWHEDSLAWVSPDEYKRLRNL
jgi:hypothetical protein